jgi:DNA repair protein RadC
MKKEITQVAEISINYRPAIAAKPIIKCALDAYVLCHNHPSGSLTPSKQDIDLTLKIKEAAKYLDIVVQDHLIITFEQKYFSFADEGLV